MKERKITINGTGQQVTITAEQLLKFGFIAADADGTLWLYEKEPKKALTRNVFVPLGYHEQHEESIIIEGDEWIHSVTPILIVSDPDAMAEAVRSLIASRLMERSDKPDIRNLLAEVTALIEAGN